jgi:two-component system, NtrC family, response regulator HydG
MTSKVLVVEERGTLTERVDAALRRRFEVKRVDVAEDARGEAHPVAVVPAGTRDAGELCRRIMDLGAAREVVLLASSPSLDEAIRAIQAGASDFVPDGDDAQAVVNRVSEAIELSGLERDLERFRDATPESRPFPELLGESAAMQGLRERLKRVANSDVTVLIEGESGTGKELVVRALHRHGPHSKGPFVGVSSSAIPRHLMESEFFGHTRGAFTGASEERVGLLAQASGGTVFLDEIADMPLDLQAKLLRALQQRTVRPLGSRAELPFDARVIAASSRDLEREVAAGRFRQDLYFRLNVIRINVPPLRERGTDVLLLAHHFIRRASLPERPVLGLTPGAARALMAHSWPGNVRELEHAMSAAVAAARYDHVRSADLPTSVQREVPSRDEEAKLVPLSELERQHILEVLRSVGGNRALAARFLGLDRKTLYRKLKAYEGGHDGHEDLAAQNRIDPHADS